MSTNGPISIPAPKEANFFWQLIMSFRHLLSGQEFDPGSIVSFVKIIAYLNLLIATYAVGDGLSSGLSFHEYAYAIGFLFIGVLCFYSTRYIKSPSLY